MRLKLPWLSLDALLRKGYLHDHSIPALSTASLAGYIGSLTDLDTVLNRNSSKNSRCVRHSIPKRNNSRRTLAIPNPQHQIPLCRAMVDGWLQLDHHFSSSKLSLSRPIPREDSERAVDRSSYFHDVSVERMLRSVGARFHLYADFSRYYSSIYTHSIAWALHGKENSRKDTKCQLLGNKLDSLIRCTQDRQSVGIPVGPDTSFIIAEIIGVAIDNAIQEQLGERGLRFVDDFHLYFGTHQECELAISRLHNACRLYELDINDAKTLIEPLPDIVDPSWKSALKALSTGPKWSSNDILGYFNLAFRLAVDHPSQGVLKYAVARSTSATVEDPPLYVSCLLRCAIAEPLCLPSIYAILDSNRHWITSSPMGLTKTLEEICRYHAPLQHGYEVAWALWIATQFRIFISDETAKVISSVDDDTVALVAMHAKDLGLLSAQPEILWQTWLTQDQLNQEHWLAAYELETKGWLRQNVKRGYIGRHPFFAELRKSGVFFYDTKASV